MPSLKDIAIQYALENKWQEACDTNLQILEENPEDIDSLNRLAFSYVKLSELDKAKETYGKVISRDNTNPIAIKNLRKIETMSSSNGQKISASVSHTSSKTLGFDTRYIEEAGKTKTVELKNLADKKTLSRLQSGEMVNLTVKRSKIFIQLPDNTYVGSLPDSIGMRLVSLIKGGNEYTACVKSMGEKAVTVFIREIKQSPKFKNQPSFITSGSL